MSAELKSKEFSQDKMQDINEALTTLRKTVESQTLSKSEIKEIETRCEERLQKFDADNTKFVGLLAEEEKKVKKLEDMVISLEAKMTRIPMSNQAAAKSRADIDALVKYMRVGKSWETPTVSPQIVGQKHLIFAAEEVKLLRTDVNPLGGFLVPEDFRAEILKLITEISPIRQIARSMTTSAAELVIPSRRTLAQTNFIGEAGAITETNSTYGEERIKVNKTATESCATIEMLHDSAFNVELERMTDVSESMAEREGRAFVNGTAVNEPEGFMFNSSIPFIVSGDAIKITGDALIELTGELKSGQQPMFVMNRRTIAKVRQLKDDEGAYLFHAGVGGLELGMPATILGEPFISAIDMPDVAADAFPIIYGDFKRGYVIANGFALTVFRDESSQIKNGIICFVWFRAVGGQVVLEDAFVKMKVSA